MIRDIVEYPNIDSYDLTSLTSCVSGGAYIDPAVVKRFIEISGAHFYLGYGLTEAGPVTHCTPIDKEPRYPSVGIPLPDTEVKIVDLQIGKVELRPEEEGELLVRGPQIMAGYWRDTEKSDRTLFGGWLHTGDVARLDRDGYTYIVDRKEEQVISSGHTVWPSKIEEVLISHPAVESVAVLGVPDLLRCANEITAMITLKSGWDTEKIEGTLKAFCRDRLKPYETPSKIGIVESLPKTPMGKVDRYALRKAIEKL
jgi:long-chain acyl-CoA synthetase